MGNNAEIREKMNTYRSILLVLNWICAGIGIIFGFVLGVNSYTTGIGFGVVIGSVILGIIGQFGINVGLAIPFILLNNGDILAALVKEKGNGKDANVFSSIDNSSSVEESELKVTDTCTVLVDTQLKNSLSPIAKDVFSVQAGEKVKLLSIQYREDLGGKWGLIETQSKMEGWVLLSTLKKAD